MDDLITNIELIDNNNLKTEEIYRVLKILNTYGLPDYQKYYLKGVLWNMMPFESEERDFKIVEYLEKSIKIKDDYLYSKTELSFYFFDKKKYLKVIEILQDLNFRLFEVKNQLWKSLKLQELLSVSKLFVKGEVDKNLYDELLGVISAYLHLPENEIAVPRELVNSLLENKSKVGVIKLIQNINILINSKNQSDYFDDKIKLKIKTLVEAGNRSI